MPFLQLAAGQSRVLEILSETAQVQFQHWIQGVAFECGGDKCPFCAQGARKTARFVMQVKSQGEELIWPMGKRVYTMLQWLAAARPSFKGLWIRLSRIGEGRDTQWLVEEVKASEAQVVSKPEVPIITDFISMPEHITRALAQIAEMQELGKGLLGPELVGLQMTLDALKKRVAEDMSKLTGDEEEKIPF